MRAFVRRWLAAVALLAPPAAATAQVVHVRGTDSATSAPLAGALASLRLGGKVLVRALTDGAGRAFLAAPAPGTYQVRVDAIGYAGTSTDVMVTGVDTVAVRLALTAKPFTLTELVVTSDKRAICQLDNQQGGVVARLWDEARKALQATELTRSTAGTLLELRTYDRRLDTRGRILTEQSDTKLSATSRPFRSRDPALLRAEGYVRVVDGTTWYHGPDAELLLSDEFLSDHCFRIAAAPTWSPLVGLAFEPAPSRNLAEIAGTLWIDAKTSELRSLEFGYVNAPIPQGVQGIGGKVEFHRLPNGAWIISDWHIRMPVVGVIGRIGAPRDSILGFQETGGSALAVVPMGGRPRPSAAIVGSVYDSLAGRPFAGVRVSIAGGAYHDTTDSAGRYRIESPIAGDLVMSFDHPRLAAFRLAPLLRDGRPVRGEVDTVDAWLPGPRTIRRTLCGESLAADTTGGLIVGAVAGAPGDTTVEVALQWQTSASLVRSSSRRILVSDRGTIMTVAVDSAGRFTACGVPRDRKVTMFARRAQRSGPQETVAAFSPLVVEQDLERPPR